MPFIRSKSKLFCLVILAGMLLLALDIHADCGDAPKVPMAAHHCCIQCCPSHNLAPASQLSIKLSNSNSISVSFYPDDASRYQDPFFDNLHRPPIA